MYPYGAAKAAAETAVGRVAPGAVVVRTSLIVGDDAQQAAPALPRPGRRARRPARCSPTRSAARSPVDDLAAAVLELADSDYAGLLNVAGPEAVSRHELGRPRRRRHGIPADRVPGGSALERGFISPAEVRLDTTLAGSVLRTRLRGVTEILA